MRTFQFDDKSLRELLEIAFQHGYAAASENTDPWNQYDYEQKQRTLKQCTWNMDYGKIILLQKPDIW